VCVCPCVGGGRPVMEYLAQRRRAIWRWGLFMLLLSILLAGQSWITYRVFSSRFPGANDFAARWSNGCALIWSGENPYSDQASLQTQKLIYGRPALPGEDLVAFSYPIYALYFFWPLCCVQPWPLVQAIWMTLMLYGVLAGTLLMMRVNRWKPLPWLLFLTLAWTVFNYPHARAVLLGQMATIVFVAVGLALLALQKEADFWAGVALAAATIKPQVAFLLLFWLLWWSAWQRRWRVWWGFGLALALMGGVGLLLVPTWPADFYRHVLNYDNVAAGPYHSLIWMVVRHTLGLGLTVEVLATSLFVVYLLWEWWRGRRASSEELLWVTGLTLNLTNFISLRVATTAYTLLLLPLFQLFRLGQRRVPKKAAGIIVGVEGFLLLAQWMIFLFTVEDRFETAPVYLLLPIVLLIAQLLTRTQFVAGERP